MPTNKLVSKLENVDKIFDVGDQEVTVLKSVSTEIYEGDFYVIFGPSGSGKSTMLYVILGLEKVSSGLSWMMEEDLTKMNEDEGAQFRKENIGMVFQQPQWIKSLSVLENVSFPLFLNGKLPNEAFAEGLEVLKVVGMVDWKDYSPSELSAGQQQRVSLARAIINDPPIIIADEPTGNLDTQAGEELMSLLSTLNKEKGKTVIMVTHDLEYLKFANRVIRIVDGEIANEFEESQIAALLENLVGKRGTGDIQNLEVAGKKKQQRISLDNTDKETKKTDDFAKPKTDEKESEKETSSVSLKEKGDKNVSAPIKEVPPVKKEALPVQKDKADEVETTKPVVDEVVEEKEVKSAEVIGPALEYHPDSSNNFRPPPAKEVSTKEVSTKKFIRKKKVK